MTKYKECKSAFAQASIYSWNERYWEIQRLWMDLDNFKKICKQTGIPELEETQLTEGVNGKHPKNL